MSREWLEKHWDKGAFAALLTFFAVQAVYFAMNFHPLVPPDEIVHLGRSELFSKSLLLPKASPETVSLGLIDTVPYLYYFLSGKFSISTSSGCPTYSIFASSASYWAC